MKPKILITSRSHFTTQPILACNKNYLDAIINNGGIPFVYGYDNYDLFNEIVEEFDGLLVTGGDDIDSKYFDEPLDPTAELEPDYIDKTDIELIKAYKRSNKPVLGICRGIQVINVAYGGSLYQDLNTSGLDLVTDFHRQDKRGFERTQFGHNVNYYENTLFYDIFGKSYGSNSYHHQAIKKLGEGLQIAGVSDDGIVEAMVGENVIAVQYHPEWLVHDEKHNQIFVEFLKKCSK